MCRYLRKFNSLLHERPLPDIYQYLRARMRRLSALEQFNEEYPCVFVLSTGRVGTQTLTELFRLSPNVIAHHEPAPKLFYLSRLAYQFGAQHDVRCVLQEAFVIARWEKLSRSLGMRRGYVESSPQATFLAPVIRQVVHEVKFIHLVRDPRDVVRSAMRRGWFQSAPADRNRIMPGPDSPWSDTWNELNVLQKNAWLWAETNHWIMEFSNSLASSNFLRIRSEDLFAGDEETICKLYSFIGAGLPSPQRVERVLNRRFNVQQSGSFPKHAEWTPSMKGKFVAMLGAVAKELGYVDL